MLVTDAPNFKFYVWDETKGLNPPPGAAFGYVVTPRDSIYVWGLRKLAYSTLPLFSHQSFPDQSSKYFSEAQLAAAGFKPVTQTGGPAESNGFYVTYLPQRLLDVLAQRYKTCL